MRRIVVLDDYAGIAHEVADWSQLPADVEVVFKKERVTGDELVATLDGAEMVILTRERTRLPREILERLPSLRHVLTSGWFNAAIDFDAAHDLGIIVTGTDSSGNTVTEFTWGLLFAVTKQIGRENLAIREGVWQESMPIDLDGCTLGLAGLGKLGTSMVPGAKLFNMNLIAWSQNLDPDYARSLGVEPVSKQELLRRADVLSIHLRLSDRTRGLFQASDLAMMKPTAFLINTSRGPIVDEAALIDALAHGAIAGAGLDVFDVEPLPKQHPFYELRNVVLTPHLGYVSRRRLGDGFTRMIDNVNAYLNGEPKNLIPRPA